MEQGTPGPAVDESDLLVLLAIAPEGGDARAVPVRDDDPVVVDAECRVLPLLRRPVELACAPRGDLDGKHRPLGQEAKSGRSGSNDDNVGDAMEVMGQVDTRAAQNLELVWARDIEDGR